MKATHQKIFRELERKERRARKLLRRQKRHKMAPKNNSLPEPGELPRYTALADRIQAQLDDLALLHRQRDELTGQSKALALTRDRLHQSFLDEEAPPATLAESLGELETERLVLAGSLEALAPRIARHETELHAQLPLAIDCFARLRSFVIESELAIARSTVRGLIDPSVSVTPENVDVLAISLPGFVAVSRITLPALSWAWNRPLDAAPPHWSSLVRPYTAQELASLRSEAVKSMLEAGNELLQAARALLAAAGPYAESDIPPFRCEAEPPPESKNVTHPEWNEGLFTTDGQFVAQHCKEAGKDPANLSDRDKAIIGALLEERRKMPVAHGIFVGEMVGSTVNPAETSGFGGPAQ